MGAAEKLDWNRLRGQGKDAAAATALWPFAQTGREREGLPHRAHPGGQESVSSRGTPSTRASSSFARAFSVRQSGRRPCHLTIIRARPPCERLQQWTLGSSTAACSPFSFFLCSCLFFGRLDLWPPVSPCDDWLRQ